MSSNNYEEKNNTFYFNYCINGNKNFNNYINNDISDINYLKII